MQNMPIGIFRGDDTDAFSYQTIVGTIKTDLDLTGCRAVFRYLDFSMEFDPIPEDKKITIVIPADETKKFPPGLGYASLRVYDSEDRLKTFSNRIMVFVATKTPMFGSDEFEVDFNVRATLEPLKFFVGPNPDDFDEYRGYVEKVIDRASAEKYGLSILLDAINSDLGAADGVAATPVAVKAAYAAIIEKLTDDYYTAEQTDEAIDRVAAYYITYDATGNPFPTYAALANATTVYSGGKVRTPTRNDYCVVLADETHQGAEYRYIYAVADGETTGSWQPQFPVEGVMTVDQAVTKNSQNPVSGGGVWSMLWGALSALPTGFSSLYDWCVAQLAGKASKADATLTPIYSDTPTFSAWTTNNKTLFTNIEWDDANERWTVYTLDGDLFVPEFDAHDYYSTSLRDPAYDLTATRTRTDIIGYTLGSQADKPVAAADPLLFAQFYPEGNVKSAAEFTSGIKYDSPDTTNRTITVKPFCNTGDAANNNSGLVGRVVIPPFVDAQGNGYITDDGTRFKVVGVSGSGAAVNNSNLTAFVAPNTMTNIEVGAFDSCSALASISLPAATTIGAAAFNGCSALASVDFGDTPRLSVPSLGANAFIAVPTSCKIIVPYTQYDAWIAADGWKDLQQEFVRHAEKADKPATFTTGNLAALDAAGNPTDSGVKPSDFATAAQGAKADAALSRDEAEAGFTEWVCEPATERGQPFSVVYRGRREQFDWWALYLGDRLIEDNFSSEINPIELLFDDTFPVTATRTRLPTMADVGAKLDAASAAPAFSSDSSVSYAVDSHCTYQGKLYKCTTATTGGAWDASKWTPDTMTDPDATLDITAQNQLRVVAKNGTLLWAQGYDLASESSATLACDATNNFTFADGATTQAFTLPTAPSGKVGDFGLDIDNSANTSAATMTLTGLDTTFSVVVPEGESLNDMLAIAAGELAQFYVTLTTFRVNNLPTWHIVKQIVENGGAQS